MMATLAIDGLDSNEIAGCKTKEREEGGDWREEKKTKGKKWREVLIKNEEEEEIEREREWGEKKKMRGEGKGEIWSSRKCAEPYESSKGQILRGKLH